MLFLLQIWAEDGDDDWHCVQTLSEANGYITSVFMFCLCSLFIVCENWLLPCDQCSPLYMHAMALSTVPVLLNMLKQYIFLLCDNFWFP